MKILISFILSLSIVTLVSCKKDNCNQNHTTSSQSNNMFTGDWEVAIIVEKWKGGEIINVDKSSQDVSFYANQTGLFSNQAGLSGNLLYSYNKSTNIFEVHSFFEEAIIHTNYTSRYFKLIEANHNHIVLEVEEKDFNDNILIKRWNLDRN
ncbi:MAG: hypothetical protein AAFV95_04870 [Bacteroidota bacterium]